MARNDQTTSGEFGLNKYGKIYAKMDSLGNIVTPIKTVEDLEKLLSVKAFFVTNLQVFTNI